MNLWYSKQNLTYAQSKVDSFITLKLNQRTVVKRGGIEELWCLALSLHPQNAGISGIINGAFSRAYQKVQTRFGFNVNSTHREWVCDPLFVFASFVSMLKDSDLSKGYPKQSFERDLKSHSAELSQLKRRLTLWLYSTAVTRSKLNSKRFFK